MKLGMLGFSFGAVKDVVQTPNLVETGLKGYTLPARQDGFDDVSAVAAALYEAHCYEEKRGREKKPLTPREGRGMRITHLGDHDWISSYAQNPREFSMHVASDHIYAQMSTRLDEQQFENDLARRIKRGSSVYGAVRIEDQGVAEVEPSKETPKGISQRTLHIPGTLDTERSPRIWNSLDRLLVALGTKIQHAYHRDITAQERVGIQTDPYTSLLTFGEEPGFKLKSVTSMACAGFGEVIARATHNTKENRIELWYAGKTQDDASDMHPRFEDFDQRVKEYLTITT